MVVASGNIDLTQSVENPIVERCVFLLLLPAAPLTNLSTFAANKQPIWFILNFSFQIMCKWLHMFVTVSWQITLDLYFISS